MERDGRERAERALRGSLLGSASLVLAAAGHALAGGGVPGWLALLTGLAFSIVVGTLLVSRRPSLPRTALVVGIGQAGFHTLFVGLGGPGVDLAAPHVHGILGAGTVRMTAAEHAAHLTSPAMLAAHAVAAAITLLLLRRAEGAVWRMLRRVLRRVLIGAVRPVAPSAPRIRLHVAARRAPRRGASPPPLLRGPPAPVLS